MIEQSKTIIRLINYISIAVIFIFVGIVFGNNYINNQVINYTYIGLLIMYATVQTTLINDALMQIKNFKSLLSKICYIFIVLMWCIYYIIFFYSALAVTQYTEKCTEELLILSNGFTIISIIIFLIICGRDIYCITKTCK